MTCSRLHRFSKYIDKLIYVKMVDIGFSSRAYCKMILHCAKYPHCSVNGVLLASNSKSKDSKSNSGLVFVDAIPLFHICLDVSPMYEIALTQIDQMAASEGLVIAGYYLANENFRDLNADVGHKVADKIAENFSSACLVVIDNRKFPSYYEKRIREPPLIISQFTNGAWKAKDRSSTVVSVETLVKANSMLATRSQDIIDFDNHLDDISLDWRNISLNEEIEDDAST